MVKAIISLHKSMLDRFGIGLSLLCLIHCMTLPVFVLIFPTIDLHESAEFAHVLIGVPVILLAIVAFKRGFTVHGNPLPVVLGTFGSLCLAGAFLSHEHTAMVLNLASAHTLLTVTGSLSLVLAHMINMKSCNCGSHNCTSSQNDAPLQIGTSASR